MNINEVLVIEHMKFLEINWEWKKKLSPNDDVNMSQSSNDTFPTSIHIATYLKLKEITIPGVENLLNSLKKNLKNLKKLLKLVEHT